MRTLGENKMGKVVRCRECGKNWEFSESKTHICSCGHRMEIRVPKQSGGKEPERISAIPRLTRVGMGGTRQRRTNDSWNYAWQPNVHRMPAKKRSVVSNSSAFNELRKQLWEELEELTKWAKEGVKIKNGIVEKLENRLQRLRRME